MFRQTSSLWRTANLAYQSQLTRRLCSSPSSSPSLNTILGISLDKNKYNPSLLNALSLENASSKQKRKVAKRSIVERFKQSESDTGSPEVQIALMTERINNLTKHLVQHKKDTKKSRTMDVSLSQRRRMMKYLFRVDPQRYMKITEELGIRPNTLFANDNRRGARVAPKRNLLRQKSEQLDQTVSKGAKKN